MIPCKVFYICFFIQFIFYSTAVSPDNMNILFLKHFGPTAINFLTSLFNLSISHANIPSIWKKATIILSQSRGSHLLMAPPIDPSPCFVLQLRYFGNLFTPIDPSPCFVLQLRYFGNLFNPTFPPSSYMLTLNMASGPTDQLPLLCSLWSTPLPRALTTLKPPLCTVSLAVDFSRAFNTVSHDLLINSIGSSNLPHNIIRWIASYLRGRSTCVQFHGHLSPYRPLKAGVPQGSVIALSLFNYYVSDYPNSAEFTTSYADDFTVAASGPDVNTASASIQSHAHDLEAWATSKHLQIYVDKTHTTLFTSHTHQSNLYPSISIGLNPVSMERRPKYLGVVFDTHLTFIPHTHYITERCCSRLKLLPALSGTCWGQQKETLAFTYKSLIRSIITYAPPIWYPNPSNFAIQRLQRLQNSALRITTGAHRMSSMAHLDQETQILSVNHSLELQCRQFLLGASCPFHPSFQTVSFPCDQETSSILCNQNSTPQLLVFLMMTWRSLRTTSKRSVLHTLKLLIRLWLNFCITVSLV